jgi:hypothetical protein
VAVVFERTGITNKNMEPRNVEPKLGRISTCWYKTNLTNVVSEASSSSLEVAYISRELIEKWLTPSPKN